MTSLLLPAKMNQRFVAMRIKSKILPISALIMLEKDTAVYQKIAVWDLANAGAQTMKLKMQLVIQKLVPKLESHLYPRDQPVTN